MDEKVGQTTVALPKQVILEKKTPKFSRLAKTYIHQFCGETF